MKKKMIKAVLFSISILIILSCEKENKNIVKDADGNIYNEIKIYDQVWMDCNLKSTKYNDGSSILNIENNNSWINDTIGAYCWHDISLKNNDSRGAIYNYNAIKTKKLCPTGWHVSTDYDWSKLEQNIRKDLNFPDSNVFDKLSSKNGWEFYGDNINPTDDYNFSAIPNGYRGTDGAFVYSGRYSWWWTSTESEHNLVIIRSALNRYYSEKQSGYAVRCVKD